MNRPEGWIGSEATFVIPFIYQMAAVSPAPVRAKTFSPRAWASKPPRAIIEVFLAEPAALKAVGPVEKQGAELALSRGLLHSYLGQAVIGRIMPRKIRELMKDLTDAGFYEVQGGGKGSHRKFTHARYRGAVTISGQSGEDAKPYQERQVKQAVEEVLK